MFVILLLITSLRVRVKAGRLNILLGSRFERLKSAISSKVAPRLLVGLTLLLAARNLRGNIPRNYTPTQFYSSVITVRLIIWIPVVICGTLTDFKGFFAHMFPKGAPIWLIVLLPIVEFVSIMLRPLILVVRLVTNLAAGHILLFIFRYFAGLVPAGAPFIGVVLIALLVIEICISILQAYILVRLMCLYIEETLSSSSC